MWFEQFAVFLEAGELVDEPVVLEIPVVNHRPEDETQRLTREKEDVRRLRFYSDLNADLAEVAEANSVSTTCDQANVQPGNSSATSVTDEAIDQALHEILNLATDFCRPQTEADCPDTSINVNTTQELAILTPQPDTANPTPVKDSTDKSKSKTSKSSIKTKRRFPRSLPPARVESVHRSVISHLGYKVAVFPKTVHRRVALAICVRNDGIEKTVIALHRELQLPRLSQKSVKRLGKHSRRKDYKDYKDYKY
ncbi:hypothetical protein ACHWQZ_G015199 [Mnemiopsis leidyi]